MQLSASNPAARRVAPYGGTQPILTPNPLAMGFPTSGDPILVDVSSSITTTTMTQLLAKKGERYPEPWGLTAEGQPTDDPKEITERGGTMMPLGGALKGHKGYGLALMVDLLGQGLSGKGRANTDAPGPLAQSAFLQVVDPDFFAGLDAFTEQSDWLANACRTILQRLGTRVRCRCRGTARRPSGATQCRMACRWLKTTGIAWPNMPNS
ncbi:Ldh family oxidoreductase [Paracoccus aerius]